MIRTVFLRGIVFLLTMASVACPAAAAEAEVGEVYCFSAADFSVGELVTGICIRSLPEEGLQLEGRTLRPGDVLTAGQLEQVTFLPREEESVMTVRYLPVYSDRVAEEAEMTLSIRGKENKIPVAEDSALETYKNLPNTAKLKAHDPEGEALTYTLVRQPRRGSVELSADGSFTYTPKKNKVGVDSFTYTAADPAGKVSREATVTVTILKPSDAAQYTDTLGKECRFAAEWMRHTGIFVGEQLAQEPCFGPEKPVTRGEFVTMLVKTLELPAEDALRASGYEDAPVWLQPYLAAAVRAGLTAGLPRQTFGAEQPISGAEAAVMLENALDTDAFADLTEAPMTRAEAAQTLYLAAKLREEQKIDTVV